MSDFSPDFRFLRDFLDIYLILCYVDNIKIYSSKNLLVKFRNFSFRIVRSIDVCNHLRHAEVEITRC